VTHGRAQEVVGTLRIFLRWSKKSMAVTSSSSATSSRIRAVGQSDLNPSSPK